LHEGCVSLGYVFMCAIVIFPLCRVLAIVYGIIVVGTKWILYWCACVGVNSVGSFWWGAISVA